MSPSAFVALMVIVAAICLACVSYIHFRIMPRVLDARIRRQRRVAAWCANAFGADHAASIPQRGIRLLEEAIEAAQSAGCKPDMCHRLIDHVFSKEPGKMHQELGGVGITLLALAEASGLDADAEEKREMDRVLAKPLSHFAARNAAKNAAGFNVHP